MDVSQYLDIFIDESSEHIQTLSDCIMTLEQEPENKDTINEIFRACPLLRKMVRGGNLGCKSGKGFYVYNADRTKTPVDAM